MFKITQVSAGEVTELSSNNGKYFDICNNLINNEYIMITDMIILDYKEKMFLSCL